MSSAGKGGGSSSRLFRKAGPVSFTSSTVYIPTQHIDTPGEGPGYLNDSKRACEKEICKPHLMNVVRVTECERTSFK